MNFASAMKKVYETQWDMVNSFEIQIETKANDTKGMIQKNIVEGHEQLNIALVSANIPQLNCTPIEFFSGGKWRIANGKDEVHTISMTFKDFGYMTLYKSFSALYKMSKSKYYDDHKVTIIFYKIRDYTNTGAEIQDGDRNKLGTFGGMISAISQIDLNNTTEGQIVEFTVEFKIIDHLH